jgi:hypothetical protein
MENPDMRNDDNDMNDRYDKILMWNLTFENNSWIQKAREQNNRRLTVELVNSLVLVYNQIDKKLLHFTNLN